MTGQDDLEPSGAEERGPGDHWRVPRLIGGLVLLGGGVVGLIETESHQPTYLCGASVRVCESGDAVLVPDPSSLGEPAYQLLEAASGLVIALGLVLLVWSLVKLARR